MTDKIIENLITNLPSLVGGIVVLLIMLRYWSKREEAMAQMTKDNQTAIVSLSSDYRKAVTFQAEQCHTVQRDTTMAINENTKQLAQLSIHVQNGQVIMDKVTEALTNR